MKKRIFKDEIIRFSQKEMLMIKGGKEGKGTKEDPIQLPEVESAQK